MTKWVTPGWLLVKEGEPGRCFYQAGLFLRADSNEVITIAPKPIQARRTPTWSHRGAGSAQNPLKTQQIQTQARQSLLDHS